MRIRQTLARGRSGLAAALGAVLLPQCASALPKAPGPGEPQDQSTTGQAYNPLFAFGPGLAPALDRLWMEYPGWGPPSAVAAHWLAADAGDFDVDPAMPSMDTGGYDAMWDDARFSEFSAYGGLERNALRVAGMRAIDGSDGASGAIPYGRLTLQRDYSNGQNELALGAYGTQVSVRQAAISGFGEDSYTDVAVDGTWRWIAHPARAVSDVIAAHILVLHETESLVASHAIFGTRSVDDFTVLRGDASWSWGGDIVPAVQYFRINGPADPVRLGTLDGSPNSIGFIAGLDYLPSGAAGPSPDGFQVRLSLQFVAYSEFDGTSHYAAHNNTVLLHLTASTDPGS